MNVLQNIKSLKDCIDQLSMLEDEEWLEGNWITEEEAVKFKEDIKKELNHYEHEIWDYLNYLSWKRQEASINLTWLKAEINRLEELASKNQNTIDRIDNWIDFILRQYWINKITTNLYQISYRKSDLVEISNEELLPKEFIKESLLTRPDKTAIKEAIKNGQDVPWATIITKQNIQIK